MEVQSKRLNLLNLGIYGYSLTILSGATAAITVDKFAPSNKEIEGKRGSLND